MTSPASPPAAVPGWRRATIVTLALLAALTILFRDTFASMAGIWWRSETFTHGFFVAPAAALVAWRLRRRVASVSPRPSTAALAAVAVAGAGWTVAHVAGIQGIEQGFFVLLLVSAVVASLGVEASRVLAFPLAFLFLMVPFGEIFVPLLIEFTARFAIAALQLSGIPVARDGDLFRIPGGQWRVVEACSGLRYLIASFTLGWFFAWWNFSSLRRRLIFVGLSIAVPIVANWFRAYLIVMLGYLSDNKIATGVDHYLYGWVFFSIVMAALFGAGRFWADRAGERGPDLDAAVAPGPASGARTTSLAAVAVGVLVLASAGPIYASFLERPRGDLATALPVPESRGGWKPLEMGAAAWEPDVRGCDVVRNHPFETTGGLVWLYTGYFADQRQDHELINTQNVLVSTTNKRWRLASERRFTIETEGGPLQATESVVRSPQEDLLVWSWYWVAGEATADPYAAKWAGARARLQGRSDAAALIAVYAPTGADTTEPRRHLAGFVRSMLPSIDSSLRAAPATAARGSTRS